MVFSETDIPKVLDNKTDSEQTNVYSIYSIQQVWLLLGLFIGNGNKQVHIFTDVADTFTDKLNLLKPENMHLKNRVFLHKCSEAKTFSIEEALNPWNNFNNQEVLSNFE